MNIYPNVYNFNEIAEGITCTFTPSAGEFADRQNLRDRILETSTNAGVLRKHLDDFGDQTVIFALVRTCRTDEFGFVASDEMILVSKYTDSDNITIDLIEARDLTTSEYPYGVVWSEDEKKTLYLRRDDEISSISLKLSPLDRKVLSAIPLIGAMAVSEISGGADVTSEDPRCTEFGYKLYNALLNVPDFNFNHISLTPIGRYIKANLL